VLALALVVPTVVVHATPLYAAREARTCDTCHLDPGGWVNPKLADRKCTLSCQACHVDPAGGGMRSASGRFLGRSTLPMVATSPRPTQDWDRELLPFLYRPDKATTYSDSLPPSPADLAASRQAQFAPHDRWAHGRPLGSPSRWSPYQGRYGALRSDPMLRVGWDVRLAVLVSRSSLAFPMQVDLPVMLHPVEHVSVLVNTGARGRRTGAGDTFDDPGTPYFREAFVLLHELPYLTYAKVGRFVPDFGLKLDDHTADIRRAFELDGSLPQARVSGVELGVNPNYPYVRASYFRSTSRYRDPDPFSVFDADEGYGCAVNAGLRAEGWALGASTLLRRRPLDEGGDASTYGLYAAFNPWFYRKSLPLTWQAEFDLGDRTRDSGQSARQAAFYQELDWRAANGLNLLLTQDWADPDRQVQDDHTLRLGLGAQITPLPGITLDVRGRALFPAAEQSGADLFVQLRFWN
jgi:hypothetical protein